MDNRECKVVIEASYLALDGVELQELNLKYGIPKEMALVGLKLCEYLKSIKLRESEGVIA